ncbi:serine-rich coiled-coil domain-containing protein 2 [Pungitius pungitius]|uniref:serine-rich coiled-coil domain-containing protein 2 n=1 Tax=Pungitius pungitius TaxID=134920 RepID=UPI002E0F76F4
MTSSSSSTQSSTGTLPASRIGSLGSKPSKAAFGLNKPEGGARGGLRQPQDLAGGSGSGPGSRSGSPLQKELPAGRCHSSDSLGSAPPPRLSESDRLRSRSLTQVRQQQSNTLTPSSTSSNPRNPSRSYSVNRAAGRGASSTKPSVTDQTPEGGAKGGGGVKVQSRSVLSIPSLLPPSALRKPLLSVFGPASKSSGISYRLSRPSLIKQSRPLRATSNQHADEQETNRGPTWETSSSPESSPEAPETKDLVSQEEVLVGGETLEDMSLSSSSSVDRNDTSQEYMDDFDNLGNGGAAVLLLSSNNDQDDSGLDQSCARFDKVVAGGGGEAAGLRFLDVGVDWTGLSGERAQNRAGGRRRSIQPEYHEQGGSSLDLSPSDSCGSGGTYMWDEEGLEPLGGGGSAATTASIHTSNGNTTHHIGSFDSDLNSIDVLNHLDSCDLEDDDLMLDEDLPEDGSLHSDGAAVAHMAQWRMRQLCWGTQDVHNDNESDFHCYKLTEDSGNMKTDATGDGDLVLDLGPQRSPGSPGLGVDVEELAEDCSAVRSQLGYLQRLLLQEEDGDEDTLTTDTLSPETSDALTQDLLQEVQQLREELRCRDRTIAHLTMQLAVPTATTRCRCQETAGRKDRHTQTSVEESESVETQTPWTGTTSLVLHPPKRDEQEPVTLRAPAAPCAASSPPQIPAPKEGKGAGKRVNIRSLRPPQPSKLSLFPPATSRPTSGTSRDPSRHQVKVGMAAAAHSGLSRLPKPKSHSMITSGLPQV